MFEIGSSLRQARQHRGLELADAERDTRIRAKYLGALEEERFDVLPDFAAERPHAWLARIVRAEQPLRISRPRPRR